MIGKDKINKLIRNNNAIDRALNSNKKILIELQEYFKDNIDKGFYDIKLETYNDKTFDDKFFALVVKIDNKHIVGSHLEFICDTLKDVGLEFMDIQFKGNDNIELVFYDVKNDNK